MGFLSGARVTDRDVEVKVQQRIRLIVKRLAQGEIDPPDASRQLIDVIGTAVTTMTRLKAAKEQSDAKD